MRNGWPDCFYRYVDGSESYLDLMLSGFALPTVGCGTAGGSGISGSRRRTRRSRCCAKGLRQFLAIRSPLVTVLAAGRAEAGIAGLHDRTSQRHRQPCQISRLSFLPSGRPRAPTGLMAVTHVVQVLCS
jgi:hypothetical protein